MKKKLKISLNLLTIIFILMTWIPVKTYATDNVNENTNVNQISAKVSPSDIIGEDISKREENIKSFILEDHSIEANIYPYPVHYKEDGIWKDIDNSLDEKIDADTNETVVENKDNSIKVNFAKKNK